MWAGITMLLFGLPCIALGFVLKNAKPVKLKASKKSKRKKKVIDAPKGNSAQSFLIGGGICTLIGLFALAKHFLKF